MLTREVDYAIRIMRALSGGQKSNMQAICEEQVIPKTFGYKIIQKLRNKEFITVERGIRGGCRLKVDLHDVTLYDLITAVQENLFINECLAPEYCCYHCSDGRECSVRGELGRIQKTFLMELQRNSLYEVLCSS